MLGFEVEVLTYPEANNIMELYQYDFTVRFLFLGFALAGRHVSTNGIPAESSIRCPRTADIHTPQAEHAVIIRKKKRR